MGETIDLRRFAGPIENDYVREWKASGRPVMGFFCAHTPEELLWAAGILPLRLRGTGSDNTSHADQYLGPFNCRFVRHTLSLLMKGELPFLDGLLVTNSCDHIRRLYDIFVAKEVAPFNHYLDVPHLKSEASFARLTGQLRDLQAKLEGFFGVSVSREALSDAIRLFNRTRALLGRVSALRALDPPRSTGSEVLALSIASTTLPRDRFNEMLEQRIAEIERADPPPPSPGPRLLILGGTLDDPGFLELIESMGASIVADQLCWGSKSFADLAEEEIDPIEAIARRILEHTPCPRMLDQYPERLANLLQAVKRHRVDGIICERLKFCDLWGGEIEMLRGSLKREAGIPLLVLERDYTTAGSIGQLRTRVQAFLETLA